MAEVLGPMQVVQQALPTGVDGTKYAEWALRDGSSIAQFLTEAGAALGALNQELMMMWGDTFWLTETNVLEYPDGGSVTPLQLITDIDRVDMVHGQTIGHMIDLNPYGGAIGGTRHYFRDARRAQINSTLRTIVNRGKWRFEQKLLTRALTNTENAIGSSGYDVPFVRGTGGNVDFTPPAFNGEAFTSSHDHFVYNNTGYAELIEDMVETLEEHGHMAPYNMWVARADVASYRSLAGFVEIVDSIVQRFDRGGATSGREYTTTGTPDFFGGGAFGYYNSSRGLVVLKATARIPTDYAYLYKPYGQNDERNSLAVRVHPNEGFGMQIIPSLTDQNSYPVGRINVEFEFGISCGQDRTNGVAGRQNSSWSNPTIS